jgi:prepilin-type N-terminal cleavage/methylation domain-containing protein
MKTNTQKLGHLRGFTLIELLVVIAIIGILASVVLASLNTARDKGANAAAKSSLNNMRAQAEIVYDSVSPNSYATVCANTTVAQGLTAAKSAAGGGAAGADGDGECNASATAWSAWVNLKGLTGAYCVDSTGISKQTAADLNSGSSAYTACP